MSDNHEEHTFVPQSKPQPSRRPVFLLDGLDVDGVLANVHYLAENRGRLLGYVHHLARFAQAQERYIDELERKLNINHE